MINNISQSINEIGQKLSVIGPRLIYALVILIVGWLIALGIAKLIALAIRKTSLDKSVSKIVGEDRTIKNIKMDSWISKAVYYLLILVVIVLFFEALGFGTSAQPFSQLLSEVFGYVPNVVFALVLLLIAWVIATLLRRGLSSLFMKLKVDERLSMSKSAELSFSKAVGEVVYWLIFLVFLPLILETLGLNQGLLEPIQHMLSKVLEFIPNIIGSAIILLVGWFVARAVQKVVINLFASAEADKFSDKIGLSKMLGKNRLSKAIGIFVYILILVPVLITALHYLNIQALSMPLSNMLNRVVISIPSVFYALIILAFAYIIGRLISDFATEFLSDFGFNSVFVKLGISKEPAKGSFTPSEVVGKVVLVFIVYFAIIQACEIIGFESLADLGIGFLIFAVDVILGIIIFGIGLYFAKLVHTLFKGKGKQAELIAFLARICIIIFAAAMALRRMGLANEIINMAFGFLIGAAAIAIAIAFGVGGIKYAEKKIQSWDDSINNKKDK